MYNSFKELQKVLNKEKPSRPVLFEMMMNNRIYKSAAKENFDVSTPLNQMITNIFAFKALGYDYATVRGSGMWFHTVNEGNQKSQSISLNDRATIFDRKSFDNYEWMDPQKCDYTNLDKVNNILPEEMKLIPMGPGGVLENVIALAGYDNLCYMLYDDEQLVWDLFEQVGTRLLGYYRECLKHDTVGAIISNDDWGFNTSTMLSIKDMRRFVFYWHKKIVDEAHSAGKHAILHSCGNFNSVIDDLYELEYDGRHSYEDNIMPVEKSYDLFKGKIAVLGGVDLDFLIRETPDNINLRSKKMIEKSLEEGGYALGSGNSIPEYVPDEHYYAMINAAKDFI